MQDKNLSPSALLELRIAKGLSQKAFWGAIGYSTTRGCSYEIGRTPIPEHVRRLVYLQHVLGVPTDIDSEEFHAFEQRIKSDKPLSVEAARSALESALKGLSNG